MDNVKPLKACDLCQCCDPQQFKFKTTQDLADLAEFIGQARAISSIQFGIGMHHDGYNIYALGPPGVGKHVIVRQLLQSQAQQQTTPNDWCYVYNFTDQQKPLALQLPAGQGSVLQRDMELLIEELTTSIPAIFESEEFRLRMQKINDEYDKKQKKMFEGLQREAKKESMMILSTPEGFVVAPEKEGKVISSEEFAELSEKERKTKESIIAELGEKLEKILKMVPRIHRERHRKERELQREFTMSVVGHYIHELKEKYGQLINVKNYLDAVQKDVVNNVRDFLRRQEETVNTLPSQQFRPGLTRYQVNVLVTHVDGQGAPVIYEENPVYPNLIGRVEHYAHLGTLITDFSLIRPGALHLANGGYLMLDVMKLLNQPFAWEILKRSLYSKKIVIEPPSQVMGFLSTVTLTPEPVPLNVKVVLLGDRMLYYLMSELDPDFNELFKVEADFADELPRNEANIHLYARLIATLARKENLLPFDCSAVAKVIDQSSRLANDNHKLTAHMRGITDLVREANYWAQQKQRKIVTATDVMEAVAMQIYRADRVREHMDEEIERNIVLIDTTGARVGQINGLSVVEFGTFYFGHPTRITATTHLGKGEVVDIEREVELGGAIHSKGVLILSGFIGQRYAQEYSLTLSASLVFEQSYGSVEGDSASVAELCALLSALANVPIKQNLAITGSVNQHGDVQAVGGINEKIEGFFNICKSRGLTGDQGVLIPAANVQHLMLREDVVQAVRDGKFAIYPIKHVDEALALLMGMPAGERDSDGHYPEGTINYLVDKRLRDYAEKAKEEKADEDDDSDED